MRVATTPLLGLAWESKEERLIGHDKGRAREREAYSSLSLSCSSVNSLNTHTHSIPARRI